MKMTRFCPYILKEMGHRLLICGSRDFDRLVDQEIFEHFTSEITGVEVVIQGEALGVDRLAKEWAQTEGYKVLGFPPLPEELKKYKKYAYYLRNKRMIDVGKPTMILGFFRDLKVSPGTKMMLNLGLKAGIPTYYADNKDSWVEVTEEIK